MTTIEQARIFVDKNLDQTETIEGMARVLAAFQSLVEWVPVSERLPKAVNETYEVTIWDSDVMHEREVKFVHFECNGTWRKYGSWVIAWKERSTPYRPTGGDDEV